MKKKMLPHGLRNVQVPSIPPSRKSSWLRLIIAFALLWLATPVRLIAQQPQATTWGNAPAPSSEVILKDLGNLGKIKKAVWSGSNKLASSEQIIHMAELDFSQSNDYKLQIAYIYQDPSDDSHTISPAECREICYYISCTSGPECTSSFQRFCEPVGPGGKQFDFVSHIAAKYGAVMATNGAFYDYFYNCVPGVKSYIKVDNTVVSKPNVLNHRNEGALAFNFSQVTPQLTIVKRSATSLEDLDNNNIYDSDLSAYPNVMSGGHLIENGVPYTLSTPSFCNGITYPWSSDPRYTGANDILKKSGAAWRSFACPTIPASYSFNTPLTPTAYGYNNLFKCSNLANLAKRKQLTCVDYAKYGEEFGGSDGLAKRSRTFIGIKDNKFYWFVADGCLTKTRATDGKEQYCKGFTIEELATLAHDMGLEKLLNFDGGSSSAFFLSGKGILQFQYEPDAEPSNLRVGPQGQRLLQTVLMLVPKGKNLTSVYPAEAGEGFARITNSTTDRSQTSYIDLSPGLESINHLAGILGKFRAQNISENNPAGQILFSSVVDQNKSFQDGLVAGIGQVPEQLRTLLMASPKHPNLDASKYSGLTTALRDNQFRYWAFKVQDGNMMAFDYYPAKQDEGWFSSFKTKLNAFDGGWHSFMLQGSSYIYDCFYCESHFYSQDFRFFIDDFKSEDSYHAQVERDNGVKEGTLKVGNATNFTIGTMLYSGTYIPNIVGDPNRVPDIHLDVQDFLFSKNFDNYYEYSEQQIATDKKYGDPEKEFKYFKSQNWTSDLYDQLHHNETAGDDGNTIFCFDETPGSKMAYAWYRERRARRRTMKAFGIYVNNASATKSAGRPRRSAEGALLKRRGIYNLINQGSGLTLHANHNPATNLGNVYLQNEETETLGKANKFLVEELADQQFLFSKPGVYTLTASGATVQTNMNFSPTDLDNYWDMQPALSPNTYYVKHKQSGKFLTGGNAGANLTLQDFDANNENMVWALKNAGEAQKVWPSQYYNVKNVSGGHTYAWVFFDELYFVDVNDPHPHAALQNQGVLLEYIGGDFYNLQMRKSGEGTYLTFGNLSSYPSSSILQVTDQIPRDQANVFIKINSDDEVEFHRTVVKDGQLKTYKAHNYYFTTYDFHAPNSEDWFVSMYDSTIPDYGGSRNGLYYSDVTYNLALIQEKTEKKPSGQYQISSLANQNLAAESNGNQVAATVDSYAITNQVWNIQDIGLGKYLIMQPGKYTNFTDSKWVTTPTYTDRKAMDAVFNSDGSVTFKYNGQCLTDNGSQAEYTLTACGGDFSQKFLLYNNKHQSSGDLNRGFYRIVNRNSSKSLVDNQAGDPADNDAGGYVLQYTYTADNDFKDEWLVEPVGNDEYLISNRKNFKNLDIQYASTNDNARVWTYSLNRTAAQRFKIKPSSDGFYQIQNSKSNKCLDVHNRTTADGEYLQQLFCRIAGDPDLSAQEFSFERIGEALDVLDKNVLYSMRSDKVSGNDAAGIYPLTFNNEDIVTYGNYQNLNKSDMWSFKYQGSQLYTIQLKGSGKLLTTTSNDVVQRNLSTAEEKPEQMWALVKNYNGAIATSGANKLISAKYTSRTLETVLSLTYGTRKMKLNEATGATSNWKLNAVSEPFFNGAFRIANYGGGDGLEMYANSNIVFMYSNSQAFTLELQSDGYYKLYSSSFNKVITANAAGTDVIYADWNAGDPMQRWSIEYTSSPGQYRIINKMFSKAIWNDFIVAHPVKLVDWDDYGDRRYQIIGTSNQRMRASNLVTLSLNEIESQSNKESLFNVFPNPSTGDLNLDIFVPEITSSKELYFNLYDMTGRSVYSFRQTFINGMRLTVRITNLKEQGVTGGVYILRGTTADGIVIGSRKIVLF